MVNDFVLEVASMLYPIVCGLRSRVAGMSDVELCNLKSELFFKPAFGKDSLTHFLLQFCELEFQHRKKLKALLLKII